MFQYPLPEGQGFPQPQASLTICLWHTSQPALPTHPLANSSAYPSASARCHLLQETSHRLQMIGTISFILQRRKCRNRKLSLTYTPDLAKSCLDPSLSRWPQTTRGGGQERLSPVTQGLRLLQAGGSALFYGDRVAGFWVQA